jgi:hypothetical protein
MGFGLWKKIKEGSRKVIGGIGQGVKALWNNVVKPSAKAMLPVAGGILGGYASKYLGGGGDDRDGGPDDNELVPRLKGRVGSGGHGIRNLDFDYNYSNSKEEEMIDVSCC